MDILYLIPARSGSKGIPKKNIKLLANKPLIGYTIEYVLEIADQADICISTDDDNVIKIAENYGLKIPFKRPPELALDNVGQFEVIQHALNFYLKQNKFYDAIVLLQPTSPFRKRSHLFEALDLYNNDLDMVVSVKLTDANPYFVLFEENSNGYLVKSKQADFKRRQDCPEVWQFNGSIYIINCNSLNKYNSFNQFEKIMKYPMPSVYSVDIDHEIDFAFAEFLLANKRL